MFVLFNDLKERLECILVLLLYIFCKALNDDSQKSLFILDQSLKTPKNVNQKVTEYFLHSLKRAQCSFFQQPNIFKVCPIFSIFFQTIFSNDNKNIDQ